MIIDIKDLHFTYPSGVHALRGIDLRITDGEQVAIVGQNGSGKTTLVKHLNGLLKPEQGSVLIGGWDTTEKTVAQMASRVGYVFQNPDEQLFTKSVYDEVTFGPQNLGYGEEKTTRLAQRALRVTDLEDKKATNPYDLSPTWRKMVALASIIAMATPIVVFDEPTTGQDAVSINRIAKVVELLREEEKTLITISHDIDFCADHFSHVDAMGEGKILLDGTTAEVMGEDETLAATYVDPPQITRLGKEIGLPRTVTTMEDFLEALREERGVQ